MVYNKKYDRWVSKDGIVYRYDSKKDKLILCKQSKLLAGYLIIAVQKPYKTNVRVHRMVYETFVGEIPDEMEIDHIDGDRENNKLNNLRCVTHTQNMNNPITKKRRSEARKGFVWSQEIKDKIRNALLNKNKGL